MPFWIVATTSPPAISAPATSNTIASSSAPTIEIARDPTAGPDVVGDVVGADVHRHVAADDGRGNQDHALRTADALRQARIEHDQDDEDQADAEAEGIAAATPGGLLELADALEFHLGGGRERSVAAVWAPRRDRGMTEL